jgi:DNA-binding response OmpR family regulator
LALGISADAPALRRLLRLLTEAGWTAYGAQDAVEAASLLQLHVPGLVFLDVALPSAELVLDRARESSSIAVVAICEHEELLREPLAWDARLSKPIEEAALGAVIARATASETIVD